VAAPVRLQTHVWNPLGDRRALLLHGLTSDGACWWRLASELADDGWMVLAPDLRGHGRSPAAIAYDLPTLAGDVELLGTAWDLVVGHSLGGAVAAHLLARSDTIAAAVLIDPVLALSDVTRRELHAEGGTVTAADVRAAQPRWDERDVHRKVAAAALCTPDVVAAVLDQNDPWSVVELATAWTARVHLVAADPGLGALLTPELAARVVTGDGRVTAEVVAGAGHSVHRDRPEAVSEAVAAVLASVAAVGGRASDGRGGRPGHA
jgi:pimeloyl-ACP methyl ester carboxylesterase